MHRLRAAILILLASILAPSVAAQTESAPREVSRLAEIPDGLFDDLAFRHVGPLGNRVPAVVGEPGNANVYYAGAASGGIWKSTDGGHQWRPIFDDQPVSSIGSLAVAPSDPNVVWAGTGESFIRANISIGNGIYRSTDKGETWEHKGLEKTGRIGRVVVHPSDPDVVFAAALGHTYGPHEERGLYRTLDGGETWEQVIFVDEDTGAIDVAIDPSNPRILYAATWQIKVWTAGRESGGPGSGLWKSVDGGATWTRLEGSGLPEPPWGKIGLAISADKPERVYALIETSSNADFSSSDPFQGVLWRSDDRGKSWAMISADNNLAQRPLYYTRATASPDDADEIHFMAVLHTHSIDGGKSTRVVNAGYDHHDMWIDPLQPDRMIVGHDGGVSISTDRGESWYQPQLPIAQMYHVATDNEIPYNLYGNRQDGPSTHGPSNSLTSGPIPIGAWRSVGGCEVGFALPHPQDTNVVWTGCYDGILEIHDRASGHSRNVSVWPIAIESWPSQDLRYRFQWTFPIAISPHDPERVYVGSQFVHQTTNRGQTWREISPDLTTADPELMRRWGGLTLDDAGPTLAPVVFALAESPRTPGVIWAGTNDGRVQVTRDGGSTWTDLTDRLPDLPARGTISNIEPSWHADDTVYLTVDAHQEGDFAPYVYQTTDGGSSWRRLDADLPRPVAGWAHCVREDPVRPGLLYLGTESAVHVSFDDGGRWHQLKAGLPTAPVHWLEIQPHMSDLVVATYGRGFWILDDITSLRALDAAAVEREAALLAPRFAYRFRMKAPAMAQPNDPAAGTNPDYGAMLHIWVAEDLADDAEVSLEVRDADGALIRSLEDVPKTAGLHRVPWNLRSDPTPEIELRTEPEENPHIVLDRDGTREMPDGGRFRLLVPPGTYTVVLTVGEETFEQVLEVRKDPNSSGTEADIEAQAAIQHELREGIVTAARTINEIEWVRAQIDALERRLAAVGDEARTQPVLETAETLDENLRGLESNFFDLRLTGAGQDSLRWKRLLYSRLVSLAFGIGQSDHRPTDAQEAVAQQLLGELKAITGRMATLSEDVGGLNQALRKAGLDGVVVGLDGDTE